MTNTINVPRELLENIVLCYNEGEFELGTLAAECHALLSAPSPAGVDGLDTDRNAAFKACPESGCDWGSFYLGWKARGEVEQAIIDGLEVVGHIDSDDDVSGSYAVFKNNCDLRDGTELVRLSDAKAIIDGLRGEVAELKQSAQGKLILRLYQHAQRIGELEGLLRAESARVDFLDAYIVTADAPDTGKAAMLADSGTLRECIDAALSTANGEVTK